MKKKVTVCLARCNQNVNSSTDFRSWSHCRRSCLVDSQTGDREFFPREQCTSECDRYWKGTVHWPGCDAQCRQFATRGSPESTPSPDRPRIYRLW
jgi:hypothetical protein